MIENDPPISPAEGQPAKPEKRRGARARRAEEAAHSIARAAESSAAAGHHAQPRLPEEDTEWQKEFFSNHRLRGAQIPRRFWNKSLANFEKRDAMRRNLVANAGLFIQGFNFKREFPQGLLMLGPVGCGKSHLAAAILREVITKGYSGLFYNSPDLLRDIRATFDERSELSEDELIEHVSEVDLLVLDDLGAEKISDFVLDRFYLIVNKRYEGCKPMIVTSNLDEETLRNRLGDRILSRFDEMCHTFGPFPNEDFRRKMLKAGE